VNCLQHPYIALKVIPFVSALVGSIVVICLEKNSKINIKGPEDLKKYKTIAVLGNKIAEDFAKKHSREYQKSIPYLDSAYLMLEKNRVEVVIDAERIGLTQIKKFNLEKKLK
jgi:ABC-type amino acid transport substrate-binding protein